MVTPWFFLLLGVSLLGVAALVIVMWWRQRRFQTSFVTLPLALVIVGVAIQQVVLAASDFSGGRSLDHETMLVTSTITALLALGFWAALATRRGREQIRENARQPRRIRELEAFAAIARLSSGGGSSSEIAGAILDTAVRLLGVEACLLMLYEEDAGTLRAAAASGIIEDSWRGVEWRLDEPSYPARVLETCQPVVVQDVNAERVFPMTVARRIGARSLLIVPLVHDGKPVGTLAFYAVGARRAFDRTSVELAELVASEAATVFEQARLEEAVIEERERAVRILANVDDGVFLVDRSGTIRFWNSAAEAITGLRSASVLG